MGLTRPYFVSRGAWATRGLALAVVALNVGEVGLQVELSNWNRRFFNAAQDMNRAAFLHEALLFPAFVAPLVCAYSLEAFLSGTMRMRWRAWLCRQCLDLWLRDHAYYRLQWLEGGGADNPDQRISDDVSSFVDTTWNLSVSFLYSVIGLFSFVSILWGLSGSIDVPLPLVSALRLPGYLVWGALIYAVIGTFFIHRVGRPLVRIGFVQQQREADFRFALVRLREHAESVALYGGEIAERRVLRGRFDMLLDNTWRRIKRNFALSLASSTYNNAATVVPWVLASGRYFAGAVKFGDVTQAAGAFGQVRHHLSVIVDRYHDIANWRATVERLAGFAAAVQAVRPPEGARAGMPISSMAPPSAQRVSITQVAAGAERDGVSDGLNTIDRIVGEGASLTLYDVATNAPDGRPIGAPLTLVVAQGERVLLAGASGAGKTTLLRAIAGLWPFGSGTVLLPGHEMLVLSQRPYLPLGTLRSAVCFPRSTADFTAEQVADALTRVGLGRLVVDVDREADWSHVLSLGEQQRVAFGRAVLARPGVLVLDEASSALDPEAEHAMYSLIATELPGAIVLSVGHRDSLEAHHHRRVVLSRTATVVETAA
jgi:putative ATP-binding cassette transporter